MNIKTNYYIYLMEYQTNKNSKIMNLLASSIDETNSEIKHVKICSKKSYAKNKENLIDVMNDLEQKVNPTSFSEGLTQLNIATQTNNSSKITSSMESGYKEFEDRVGRPMTYAEMRSMWG